MPVQNLTKYRICKTVSTVAGMLTVGILLASLGFAIFGFPTSPFSERTFSGGLTLGLFLFFMLTLFFSALAMDFDPTPKPRSSRKSSSGQDGAASTTSTVGTSSSSSSCGGDGGGAC